MEKFNCIVVLGSTAAGKTRIACHLAYYLHGEIISADSRQVYKHLDIGTGKDLEEYHVKGKPIPYHLIDSIEPEEQFYLHQFAEQLQQVFYQIRSKNALPIICGGTGLYLDALRKNFSFTQIKENPNLRGQLEIFSKAELLQRLQEYSKELTQHVDLNSTKRMIRGIEIADYLSKNKTHINNVDLPYKPYYIGIQTEIEIRKKRISERLINRLNSGLIEEVEALLKRGITPLRLELFGLEYKFVSYYLLGKMSKEEMTHKLQTAIFQFAKRQMTWFRKMEKEGVTIHWLDPNTDIEKLCLELSQKLYYS